MPRQHHYIKCETQFYQDVESGNKKFEFRKNDRNYRVGDMVYLLESVGGIKTGRVMDSVEIKYILHGPAFGLPDGYCIFNW